MKAPRDYQAELDALQKKAALLRTKRVQSLGELVLATGADALPMDVLAGVLLSAVNELNTATTFREDYAKLGADFFQPKPKAARGPRRHKPKLAAVPDDAA